MQGVFLVCSKSFFSREGGNFHVPTDLQLVNQVSLLRNLGFQGQDLLLQVLDLFVRGATNMEFPIRLPTETYFIGECTLCVCPNWGMKWERNAPRIPGLPAPSLSRSAELHDELQQGKEYIVMYVLDFQDNSALNTGSCGMSLIEHGLPHECHW